MAGSTGMGRREPEVQRHEARLEAETQEGQRQDQAI